METQEPTPVQTCEGLLYDADGSPVRATVKLYDYGHDRDGRAKKTRVYMQGVEGESVIDNLLDRRNRPYKLLAPLVTQVLHDEGVEFTKANWSQYAGCSCPCSPGWILQGTALLSHAYGVTFSLTTPEKGATR